MRRNVLGGIGLVLVMVLLVFVLGFFFTNVGRKDVPAAQPSPSSGAPQQPPDAPRVESQLWGQRVKLADDVRAPRLALSPDGGKIAYVSVAPPPRPQPLLTSPVTSAAAGQSDQKPWLVVLDTATGKTLYREEDTLALYYMAWSRDNETLTYVSYTDKNKKNKTIASVRFDGTGRTALLPPDRYDLISVPEWSPDGTRIAFTSKNAVGSFESETALWVMNKDGTNLRKLLGGRSQEIGRLAGKPMGVLGAVIWVQGGGKLLFGAGFASRANALEAEESMLFTVPPDGGTPVAISPPFPMLLKIVSSPDGQRILYLREMGELGKPRFSLWSAKADGSSAAPLDLGDKGIGFPDPVGWSPDGTKVVFYGGAPRNEGLWVADWDGKNAVELVTRAPGEYITRAGMSGDGRTVAFVKVVKPGKLELWLAR